MKCACKKYETELPYIDRNIKHDINECADWLEWYLMNIKDPQYTPIIKELLREENK